MGLKVRLEDEDGEELDILMDPHNLLHRLLPRPDDSTFICLRFVDWYGNTVFNRGQAATVLSELDRLRPTAKNDDERLLLDEIANFARRCADEPHLYLKFYGD